MEWCLNKQSKLEGEEEEEEVEIKILFKHQQLRMKTVVLGDRERRRCRDISKFEFSF